MPDNPRAFFATALAMALAFLFAGTALAQPKGGGRIICWTDKSGKVVGCGDRVPPEYEGSATRELDRGGVTRRTTESAEIQTKRAAQEAALAKQREEEKKRLAEQRRRDTALLSSYANEQEIDLRRDRELQEVDRVIKQFEALHKSAAERRTSAMERLAAAEKSGNESEVLTDEIVRAQADMAMHEKSIAGKNKEKEEIYARYAQTKQRYMDLQSGRAQAAEASEAPAKK